MTTALKRVLPPPARRLAAGLVSNLRQLLHVHWVLRALVVSRYYWRVKIRRKLRTLDSSPFASANAVSHNLRNLLPGINSSRTELLVRPLSALEALGPTVEQRVLAIGPRSEAELFRIWAYGYQPRNVRGVDLISYSPWVDLGDMHALPYPDNSFDAVVCGWVIAYSENKTKAVSEIVRVLRPGGVAAIGVEYAAATEEELIAELGYLPGSSQRLRSTQEILALFGESAGHVYFDHGITPGVNDTLGNLLVVVAVNKPEPK